MKTKQREQIVEPVGTVLFDFESLGMGRYFYPLVYSFYLKGYKIYIKDNYHFIGNCFDKDTAIFEIPGVQVVKSLSGFNLKDIIYISEKSSSVLNQFLKYFIVNFDVFTDFMAIGERLFPFPMAHDSYYRKLYEEVGELRNNKRTVKIFFSGNTEEKNYNNPFLISFFKVLPRSAAINAVKLLINDEDIQYLRTIEDYSAFDSSEYKNKILLTDWSWSVSSKTGDLNSRIDNSQWLRTLSKADFFLCLPGTRIPHCHNLPETMSVGTIPILEYNNLLYPPLKDMETCVSFSGEEELIEKINKVLEMSEGEIERMRRKVVEYYDKNLKTERFVEKLEYADSGDLYLIASGKSAELKLSRTV